MMLIGKEETAMQQAWLDVAFGGIFSIYLCLYRLVEAYDSIPCLIPDIFTVTEKYVVHICIIVCTVSLYIFLYILYYFIPSNHVNTYFIIVSIVHNIYQYSITFVVQFHVFLLLLFSRKITIAVNGVHYILMHFGQ